MHLLLARFRKCLNNEILGEINKANVDYSKSDGLESEYRNGTSEEKLQASGSRGMIVWM